MGCHKIIGAQDNPEIGKIHGYSQRGEPIPWVRVFKLPEFTHFPHKPHIRAELACQTCHGPIERMRVVGAQTGPRLVNDLAILVGMRAAAAPPVDGLVRGLSPAAERHAGDPGSARLRRLPSLRICPGARLRRPERSRA